MNSDFSMWFLNQVYHLDYLNSRINLLMNSTFMQIFRNILMYLYRVCTSIYEERPRIKGASKLKWKYII